MDNRFVNENGNNQQSFLSHPEQLLNRPSQPREPYLSNGPGTFIQNGFPTGITTPILSGGLVGPGAKVIIMVNGEPIGEAIVHKNGYWSFTIDQPLSQGEHIFTVIAVSATGVTSTESDPFIIYVETAPAPVITAVFDDQNNQQTQQNGTSTDKTPTLKGTAEPGRTLEIVVNGIKIGETLVDENGNWAFTPTEDLQNGFNAFSTSYVNAEGYPGLKSEPYSLNIERTGTAAPGKPGAGSTWGVIQVVDDHGQPIADGAQTSDTTPTLQGSGMEPGGRVVIYLNGTPNGMVRVDEHGNWIFTPRQPLPVGQNTFSVIAISSIGLQSEMSDPLNVLVTPPAIRPTISEVLDDNGTPQHNISADNTPTLKGTGQPGVTLGIYTNGKKIGETLVDERGNWAFTPDVPLSNGHHHFTAQPAGQPALQSYSYMVLIQAIDTTAPAKPGAGGTGGAIQIVDDHGQPIADGAQTSDTTPTLQGSGMEPGGRVVIYLNGTPNGMVRVDEHGNWIFTPRQPLPGGQNTFSVIAISSTGIQSEMSDPLNVLVTPPTIRPTISEVLDDNGTPQYSMSADNTPTLKGTGQPGVTLGIYTNGKKIGETLVDERGNWAFTPVEPLSNGHHHFTAQSAGQPALQSYSYTVLIQAIDTTPPGKPGAGGTGGVIQIVDDYGQPIADGTQTNDTTPTLQGSGMEPGGRVIIYLNGMPIGMAPVDNYGNWKFTPFQPLPVGQNTFSVIAVSSTGIKSEMSDPLNVLVKPPAIRPTISEVLDDNGTPQYSMSADNTPTLKGTGQPGVTLGIYTNGKKIGETLVDERGNWAFTPVEPLSNGHHHFTAQSAGQPALQSYSYTVLIQAIDTTPPGKPGAGGTGGVIQIVDDYGQPIADGTQTNDTTPTLQGSGMEPGGRVIIYLNGMPIGMAPVDNYGNWKFTPFQPLPVGQNTFSVIAVSSTGIKSEMSDPLNVLVTPPAIRPTISEVLDDNGNPQYGMSADNTPTLKGAGQPGVILEIYANGKKIGETLVDERGNWVFTTDKPLADGVYNFNTKPADAPNQPGEFSQPYSLTIEAPEVTTPDQPGTSNPGYFLLLDDNGDYIANGALAKDNTPTIQGFTSLSGGTAIIMVNGQRIGEAAIDVRGGWTYEFDQPLAKGQNAIQIITIDTEGHESKVSAPYIVHIGDDGSQPEVEPPVEDSAPAAIASIDSMSKDSGADHNDFITRDGSAGRLIRGSLTKPLAENEKVQISVNGGNSWDDAVLNGDGSWSFVDQTEHSLSWEIKTRVINSVTQSKGKESSQSVNLDRTSPHPPKAIEVGTDTVTVKFDGDGLVEGASISLSIGGQRIDYPLSAADIAAGTAHINVPHELQPLDVGLISAAVINAEGYSSQIITRGEVIHENFSGVTDSKTYAQGRILVLDSMQIKVLNGLTRIKESIGTPDDGDGLRLHFGLAGSFNGMIDKLEISAFTPCSRVSFTTSDLEKSAVYEFYDTAGNLLARLEFDGNKDGYTVSYTAPEGMQIGKIIASTGELGYLDNFEFGGLDQMTWKSDPGEQTISGETPGAYIGSWGKDLFLLENPEAFVNSPGSSIHGYEGIDTLRLTGQDQILDMAALGNNISSIEIVDLTGSGDNTLKLSLDDVLNNGTAELYFHSGAIQMMIKGDEGDAVELQGLSGSEDPGVWAVQGQVNVGGVAYDVYRHSALDAELLVQQGVTTNLIM